MEGDVIKIDSISGVVEKFSLRRTAIRDLGGTVHVIPNGQIKIVSNATHEWSRVVLDILISYKEDIDKVSGVLNEVGENLSLDENFKKYIIESPKVLEIDKFGKSGIIIKMISKTAPNKQWGVKRELLKRIKEAFNKEGIEMPYPHYVIIQK